MTMTSRLINTPLASFQRQTSRKISHIPLHGCDNDATKTISSRDSSRQPIARVPAGSRVVSPARVPQRSAAPAEPNLSFVKNQASAIEWVQAKGLLAAPKTYNCALLHPVRGSR